MNPFSKKLSLALVSAALVFAGCTKKPKRPSPGETIMGVGAGGGINPTDGQNLGGADPLTTDTSLEVRPAGVIETDDMIKGLLQPVYFDFDSSSLKASERTKLQDAQRYLSEHPQYRLLLEGHCDWKGTAEYNTGLGDRRANAAKSYIQTLGVPAAKLETLSKGDLDAVENAPPDVAAKDRKVELIILKK